MGKDKEPSTDTKKASPQSHPQNNVPAPQGPKGAVGQKVGCTAVGCKDKDMRHGFCTEHFHQFKFGLINKKGEPVLDYEKKLEHYQKWKTAQKVA